MAADTSTDLRRDLQCELPDHRLPLDEVGSEGLRGRLQLAGLDPLAVEVDISCSLGPDQRGVHVSRFAESLAAVLAGEHTTIARAARAACSAAIDAQGATAGRVRISGTVHLPATTPASGRQVDVPVQLTGHATIGDDGASTAGTTVHMMGMTACPCAQHLVETEAAARLERSGLDAAQVATVLDAVPMATHNQRAACDLTVDDPDVPLHLLVEVAEHAFSAPILDLLKRDDELAVVLAAHAAPRFVEDSIRAVLQAATGLLGHLPPDTGIRVHQRNFESIHTHDVSARHATTLGALRTQDRAGEAP